MIVTPDQRVRVFVSSTLEELAAERVAAREAIEALRLIPVLFELGARPHAPRSLYRSYLEQSDIFVGIYGERYGWVGPGMNISGLEDEYRLATAKPRLLYIKKPAPARDDQLRAFIDRIRESGEVSYRSFADATELRSLLADDLAVLLSERFQTPPSEVGRLTVKLPTPVDSFIGREREMGELERQLRDGGRRLVTITGPGGVGKTRLALEVARGSREAFADGAHFVSLGEIAVPELIFPAIQRSLELPAGSRSAFDAVVEGLREAELLLVLDNFEQVLAAATDLSRLLEECDRLTALVTSRAVLELRGEREFPLQPFRLPAESVDAKEIEDSDSIALFVERARAANPAFTLTDGNRNAVFALCKRLDGLPLAIELAAVQVRLLSPETMLERLQQRLELMPGRAYPERQQTLRATMDWSYQLLDEAEKVLFSRASVFRSGWTLEALDAVYGEPSLELLSSLVGKSLVVPDAADGDPRFSMLRTLREYADEKLEQRGDVELTRERHAEFYLALIEDLGSRLRAAEEHEASLVRLDREEDNLRAVVEWLLQSGGATQVADVGWWLLPYWGLRERLAEGRRWMAEALAREELPQRARARALTVGGVLALWASDYEPAIGPLTQALAIFRALGDETGVALAQLPLGVVESITGDQKAGLATLEDSQAIFERVGHEWGVAMTMFAMSSALNATRVEAPIEFFEETVRRARMLGPETETVALGALAQRRAIRGERNEAKRLLAEVLRRVTVVNAVVQVGFYLDLLADVAAEEGDDRLATRLSASAEVAFEAGGSQIRPLVGARDLRLAALRERLGDVVFENERESGYTRGVEEATTEALAWAERETDSGGGSGM
jgi:predicted ATPase